MTKYSKRNFIVIAVMTFFFGSSICQEVENVLIGGVTSKGFMITGKRSGSEEVTGEIASIISISATGTKDAAQAAVTGKFKDRGQNYFEVSFSNENNNDSIKEGVVCVVVLKIGGKQVWTGNVAIPNSKGMRFIVSSNLDSNSHSFVLDKIKNDTKVNFFMFLGNMFKSQKTSDKSETYVKQFEKYLFKNKDLYGMASARPFIYFFNDLDFSKKNSHASKNQNTIKAMNDAYRTVFPYYDLPEQKDGSVGGIYQKAEFGNNILFLMTDARSFLDLDNKKYFGDTQRNWLKDELTKALGSSSTINTIIITTTQPWNYVKEKYDADIVKQKYDSLNEDLDDDKKVIFEVLEEKKNDINFLFTHRAVATKANGTPKFVTMLLITGERHLALDEGSFNNFGGFPMAVAGPLDSWQQCRGGPYSHGSFHDSKNQYLDITVTSGTSDTNNLPCIIVQGIIASKDEENLPVFAYSTCSREKYPGRLNRKCPMDWKEKLLHAFLLIIAALISSFIFFFVMYWNSTKALTFKKAKIKTA